MKFIRNGRPLYLRTGFEWEGQELTKYARQQDADDSSSTKTVVRFHTPEISRLIQEREQHKEILQVEADKAYKAFLQEIAQHYSSFRDVVNKLATADCLMSLATFSLQGDVCKPKFVDGLSLSIVDGRHPIIEHVRPEPYVPNSVSLGGNAPRHLVISGPNVSAHIIISYNLYATGFRWEANHPW